MRIGVLTGGGDVPGLNAAIRGVVAQTVSAGDEVQGIRNGWAGLMEADGRPLAWEDVADILAEGGTILGTSRTNPLASEGGAERALAGATRLGLDAVCAIGGDDTLGVAVRLGKLGLPCVGVPKTMDNDVFGTDYTIGFHTAVSVAMEAVDRLETTARSHGRVMVLEVMGRDAGWVALTAGLAAGADAIIVPEEPPDLEAIGRRVTQRPTLQGRRRHGVVVVAEGVKATAIDPDDGADGDHGHDGEGRPVDAFGHVRLGGVGQVVARAIERITGLETRATSLGHIIRGGSPSMFDRVLATRLGIAAARLAQEGRFGRMVCLQGTEIGSVTLDYALSRSRRVDPELLHAAGVIHRAGAGAERRPTMGVDRPRMNAPEASGTAPEPE